MFTIRRLMIASAVVAAFMTLLRGDLAGDPLLGASIVVACALILAGKLTVNGLARERSSGRELGWGEKIWIGLGWSLTAVLIIIAANVLFLFVYSVIDDVMSRPHLRQRRINPVSLFLAVLSTVLTIHYVRRGLHPKVVTLAPMPPADGMPDPVDPELGLGATNDRPITENEKSVSRSVAELSAPIPHGQVGVTTVGQVRAAGGDVVQTSGRSPNHATLTGLTPEKISQLLTPTRSNPTIDRS